VAGIHSYLQIHQLPRDHGGSRRQPGAFGRRIKITYKKTPWKIIRLHPIRHDRAKEHGAFAQLQDTGGTANLAAPPDAIPTGPPADIE
jgi:hypothetical protein